MKLIEYESFEKHQGLSKIKEIYKTAYSEDIRIDKHIRLLLDRLKDEVTFISEFPYVDKVYRDSYYTYFSSKLKPYHRDCIRVSIFDGSIDLDHYQDQTKYPDLYEKYLGFFVIRPIPAYPLGRSIFSPQAYTNDTEFLCCQTKSEVTSNGLKFNAIGFPYASQNTETLSCAETTLWAVMEYFSSRYAEYQPILPSDIISTLRNISIERQLPSAGLDVAKLSYALKNFGFGTKIYSRRQFGDELDKIIGSYVESGIPIIVTLENGTIGHACLCIGREKVDISDVKNANIADFDEFEKQFVFIDDNYPPYQLTSLKNPTCYYSDPRFQGCEISNIIVPLYPKIYLEAHDAKTASLNFFSDINVNNIGDDKFLRCFLMSSRSFKDFFVKSNNNTNIAKDVVQQFAMPKFIWVSELIDKKDPGHNKVQHLLLLDATELNQTAIQPLLLCMTGEQLYTTNNGRLTKINLNSVASPFELITHNLNG